MENNANNRLVKGTIVYMIGNMTSKILQMLILPLITVVLLTEEYGYYDLVITTINLVTPIITLQIIEGMFRFSFDSETEDKKTLVSTTTAFLCLGIIVLGVAILAGRAIYPALKYPWLIYTNYISAIFFDYSQKLARSQQLNKQFAVSGVLHTISMLAIQAITLLIFKMRIDGMLIASLGSYIVGGIYLQIYVRADKYISKQSVSIPKIKELLTYSAPLVPNSIAWWLVASSDRYIITFFIDTAANGIYGIAGKFSQLLTFATGVFQMAWQESAILEANSEKRDEFYTNTFNTYMKLLLSAYLVILPMIRILFPFLGKDYQVGYVYNPILLIGAVFAAFSQFYGSSYIVFKKTSGAFVTSLIAAIINIIVGISTVKYIGLYGPALGTAIAFLIQWIIRAYQMKPYFKVKINIYYLILLSVLCVLTIVFYYFDGIIVHITQLVIGAVVFFIVNKDIVASLISKVRGRVS